MSRAALFLILVSLNRIISQDEKELKVEVLLKPEGCAELSTVGDTVHIHYTGKLEDGTLFDNSLIRDPLVVELGKKQVIPGLEQGLIDMCVGKSDEKYIYLQREEEINHSIAPRVRETRLPALHSRHISGDSVLLFETELVTLVKSTYWKKLMDNVIPIVCLLLVPGLLCLIGYYLYLKANVPKISKRKLKDDKKNKAKNK